MGITVPVGRERVLNIKYTEYHLNNNFNIILINHLHNAKITH